MQILIKWLHFVCDGFKKLVAQNKAAQLVLHLDGVADHEVLNL